MAETGINVALVPCCWNSRADAWLARVDWDDAVYSLKNCRDDVCRGSASLYFVTVDGEPVGCVVLRDSKRELVVMAAAGDLVANGTNLIRCEPLITRLAERKGLQSIRWHTSRPTMALLASRMGYEVDEIVFRKKLNGSRS